MATIITAFDGSRRENPLPGWIFIARGCSFGRDRMETQHHAGLGLGCGRQSVALPSCQDETSAQVGRERTQARAGQVRSRSRNAKRPVSIPREPFFRTPRTPMPGSLNCTRGPNLHPSCDDIRQPLSAQAEKKTHSVGKKNRTPSSGVRRDFCSRRHFLA